MSNIVVIKKFHVDMKENTEHMLKLDPGGGGSFQQ